jgi:anti-sigma regulatory factor (Ser/Thr protein kinase)
MIETINVAEILETLVLTFREFGAEHSKRITWRSNLESVAGDRYMLTRVLSNLIKNAILYSRGERVLIVCRGFEDHVDFRVYDQGPGMSAADLARVLNHDRSMRLSLQTQGIGIGLRNCAKLAASYGGELEAASRSDGGSMFGLRLPTPGLSAIRKPLNFLGDKRVWQSYAAVLDKGRLVDTHNGKADELYVFTENVEIQSSAGINVVACVDRSSENRDKWARVADAMLCFPITLPALAYAVWLASRRSSLEVSS